MGENNKWGKISDISHERNYFKFWKIANRNSRKIAVPFSFQHKLAGFLEKSKTASFKLKS